MNNWTSILRQNFTSWETLANFLELSLEDRKQVLKKSDFVLNLPLRLAKKIQKGTLDDPLIRQFLPLIDEEKVEPGFSVDPVGDLGSKKKEKLLHKYQGRCLLLVTSACAMHCRYCFRRHFPYETGYKGFDEELALIEKDHSLEEVILSGGDPLSLPDRLLEGLFKQLNAISHVKRVRFHTRFPIGIPERINSSFLKLFESLKKQLWFVVHINHERELDDEVIASLKALRQYGPVLTQTVLLKEVNDSFDALFKLCQRLINEGIQPYYLHQLDKVQGGAHFEVDPSVGLDLIQQLRKILPGYAIFQYVQEIAGEGSKTPIQATF